MVDFVLGMLRCKSDRIIRSVDWDGIIFAVILCKRTRKRLFLFSFWFCSLFLQVATQSQRICLGWRVHLKAVNGFWAQKRRFFTAPSLCSGQGSEGQAEQLIKIGVSAQVGNCKVAFYPESIFGRVPGDCFRAKTALRSDIATRSWTVTNYPI